MKMNMYLCTTRIKSEYYALLQTYTNDRSHHRHHIIRVPSSSLWVWRAVKGINRISFLLLGLVSKQAPHQPQPPIIRNSTASPENHHPTSHRQHPRHDPPSSTSNHPTSYNKIMNYKYNNFSNNKHSSGIQSNNGKERRRNDVWVWR